MTNQYLLIDLENVQPTQLQPLRQHAFKVYVFVGASQSKVPFELAAAMQTLGDAAQYVKVSGNGKNALDFHIAFYIGEIAAKDKGAHFHILSEDTGFDPLIAHLKTRQIQVCRHTSPAQLMPQVAAKSKAKQSKLATVLDNLISRGASRPRTVKTLSNTINALFDKSLTEQQLATLLREMETRGHITIRDAKVSYTLPKNR